MKSWHKFMVLATVFGGIINLITGSSAFGLDISLDTSSPDQAICGSRPEGGFPWNEKIGRAHV